MPIDAMLVVGQRQRFAQVRDDRLPLYERRNDLRP
jgi:hypothetical protein